MNELNQIYFFTEKCLINLSIEKKCKLNFLQSTRRVAKKARKKNVEIFVERAERISKRKRERKILTRGYHELFDFAAFGCQVKLIVLC